MIRVAQSAAETHPHAAVDIYRQQVESLIEARGRDNYQRACTYLTKVRDIYRQLAKIQHSPSRFRPQPFLESLYRAYLALSQSDTADRLKLGGVGQVIRLDRIYNLFTGLPGAQREYSQLDFARDLYSLENSGVNEARSGDRVSFPASTGTRNPGGTISFVGPNGETVLYYGIQFTGTNR